MNLKAWIETLRPPLEEALKKQISELDEPATHDFHEMLTDHMGWTGDGAGLNAQGKRLRPTLLLLTTAASGVDWHPAIPAATAVELVHNFSLVHDDIQDASEIRHGRATIWKKWGVPQGINAGDGLFVLANQAMMNLLPAYPESSLIGASLILQTTCLDLTRGQFLDMAYEQREDVTIQDYWVMVKGKTASLFSACTEIGSLLAEVDDTTREDYREFGHYLGLGFQVYDDYLGIWGDSALTGKSSESDLLTGKKSLPVLYGLAREGLFSHRYAEGNIQGSEVAHLAEQLEKEGAKLFTLETADQMSDLAVQSLRKAGPKGDAGEALYGLVKLLTSREA